MAEIIDVLTTQGSNQATFTVNTAVTDVPINASPIEYDLLGAPEIGFYRFFQPDDSIRILSLGVILPYHFVLSTRPIYLQITYQASGGISGGVFPNGGYICTPFENYELACDVFFDYPVSGKQVKYTVHIVDGTGSITDPAKIMRVSMIGVPASLNGQTLPITVFIKVLHTLQMIS